MPSPPSSDEPDATRKRVGKACDRCRLKKSKCDGAQPCARCKHEDACCVFGERKRIHDKTYPKGYVEMLERDRFKLTNGLQSFYKSALKNGTWEGKPLKEGPDGRVLTHDILECIGCLHAKQSDEGGNENFEDDLRALQASLFRREAAQQHPTPPSATRSTFTFSEPGSPMPQNFALGIVSDPLLFPIPTLGPSPPLSSPSESGEFSFGSSFPGTAMPAAGANQQRTYTEGPLLSPYQPSGQIRQWDQSPSFDANFNSWPSFMPSSSASTSQFNGYTEAELGRSLFDVN